jgi:hypothetical protein
MTLNRESKMGCRATSANCVPERAVRDGVFIDHAAGEAGKWGKQIGKCLATPSGSIWSLKRRPI